VKGSESRPPPTASHGQQSAQRDAREAAIDELARLILELASAIARLDYTSAIWGRHQLVQAVAQADRLAVAGASDAPYDGSLRRLVELRMSAEPWLAIAPKPSPATLAATATGDMTAWDDEARQWIATGEATVAAPRRRNRDHTWPDSPKALRDAPDAAADEGAAPSAPSEPAPSHEKVTR
jgi:hypothetical protein